MEEEDDSKIFLVKDNKQVMSVWDFMEQTGLNDKLRQQGCTTLIPTHSFELMKQERLKLFEKEKLDFIEDREMKKLVTTDFEISSMYCIWLKDELQFIKKISSNTYLSGKKRIHRTVSDVVEISKYKQFVSQEIVKCESVLTPIIDQKVPSIKKTKKPLDIIYKHLSEVVVDAKAKDKIYEILIAGNRIDPITKLYVDNKGVGDFYSIIEDFRLKGYFKMKLSQTETLNICENIFKIKIGISTAKNKLTRRCGISNIPHFTTIH